MVEARFGNLSVLQFEEKTQVELSVDDRLWMVNHQSDNVDVGNDKFHIFNLPFNIVAGHDCGEELVKRLTDSGYQFKRHFTVTTLDKN